MEPRLLHSLRLAMATLYSLPLPHGSSYHGTHKEANDFLIEIQSRNARRKILSIQQRHRDNANSQKRGSVATEETVQMGSSWLAFMAVLCQMNGDRNFVASPPERLFAAQSVLHRARRSKLVESIDIEVEMNDIDEQGALQMYQNGQYVLQLVDAFRELVRQWNPFVFEVLKSYTAPIPESSNLEGEIKVDLMVLSLAAVSYITACQPDLTPHRTSILEALGSTITTLTLRTRFSDAAAPDPDQSLVWMVSQTFRPVFEIAKTFHPEPRAAGAALTASLGAIPETILGNSGGARGKMSVDPRTLEGAVNELRSRGFGDLWRALQDLSSLDSDRRSIFIIMEKWAKFLCVPSAFVDEIAGALVEFLSSEDPKPALLFLLAVFEGGTWNDEQVVKFSLGLSESQNAQQSGKRRQTSKSKKRQKELVSKKIAESASDEVGNEIRARGEVACRVASVAWPALSILCKDALLASSNGLDTDVEGPIGCVSCAAQSCIPFLLVNGTSISGAEELLREVSRALVLFCGSNDLKVRGLSFLPLYAVNRALVTQFHRIPVDQKVFIQDILLQCMLSLAKKCNYPADYFDELKAESDEELEVCRNDVRDLFRGLAGGDDELSESGGSIPPPSFQILSGLTRSLKDELLRSQQSDTAPPETLVHAYTALAKPFGRLAKDCFITNDPAFLECLYHSLEVLSICLNGVAKAFDNFRSVQSVLPVSRTLCMGVASFAPMLGAMARHEVSKKAVSDVLPLCSRLALVSLRFLPELAISVTLVPYEIRGTMRGPGGEDHVASILLMRLTSEHDDLTALMVRSVDMKEMCELHEYLKSIETLTEDHDPRTAPKSRRILLGVICKLELSSSGQAGASEMLVRILQAAVSSITSVDLSRPLDVQSVFILCETAFDIASLAAPVLSSFFAQDENNICLSAFQSATIQGYQFGTQNSSDENLLSQWNRLRGALFTLFLASANPDFSEATCHVLLDLISSECAAAALIFGSNGPQGANIFNDEIVSPETIPSGIFIMSVGKQFGKRSNSSLPMCAQIMCQAAGPVLNLVLVPVACPDGFICDPRCSIAEAWFLSVAMMAEKAEYRNNPDPRVAELLANSVVAAVSLIFSVKLVKDSSFDGVNGMSMDGPQTLAMMEFLSSFFALGSARLSEAVSGLALRFPIQFDGESSTKGLAILVSALFRAIQGALPPWVLESVPGVFSNLYNSMGKNPQMFGEVLRLAMELRLPGDQGPRLAMGGVEPGELLSGHFFESIGEASKLEFRREGIALAEANTHASWKRFKHCVKGVCGGKKKDSDFGQKPAVTRWEYDRM